MSKILIKNGRVIDPAHKVDKIADVLIVDGLISKIAPNIELSDVKVIESKDKIVCPGLIDMHVHLREPGREDEETIKTGSRAAIAGGITSLACMPNTDPVNDNEVVTKSIINKAKSIGLVDVYPIGSISKDLEGKTLSEMAHLSMSGAVAFSDDGKTVMDSHLMRQAFDYAKSLDRPVIVHCEDQNLASRGQMNEGRYSTSLGLEGIPAEAEEFIVARDLMLAKLTNSRVHIAHVSTSGSVALVRKAKEMGVNATCEVTPHHLILDESMLVDYDTNLKVNPPLRTKEDQQALLDGLKDGTIDVIASDHAPHAAFEKEAEFAFAPNGMIGMETMLPLVLTYLDLELPDLLKKLTASPAKILGIKAGSLSTGSKADVVIINNKAKLKVEVDKFYSKSKNSPFRGYDLKAKVDLVIKGGRVVYPHLVDSGKRKVNSE